MILAVPILISLLLTEGLELLFALIWGVRGGADYCLILLANLLTNPAVVFLRYTITGAPAFIFLLESSAVLIEGALYARRGRTIRRPWIFSLCANAFSFGLGLLLARFI